MSNTKKIPTEEMFMQVAAQNGYEVFSAEEIAAFTKASFEKSVPQAEREEAAVELAYLTEAKVMGEDGVVKSLYYRKEQVNWNKAEDGSIMKGLSGTYADTDENRKLNRVGKPFQTNNEIIKSILQDGGHAIVKAYMENK